MADPVALGQLFALVGLLITAVTALVGGARWAGKLEADLRSVRDDVRQLRERLGRLEDHHLEGTDA